jgi:histidinol-phosphate/aromatic aminotransferase/cobyric acid decarboxylase-like protein
VLINDASSYPELDNYLRISVGRPEQNDLVVQGFREMSGLS